MKGKLSNVVAGALAMAAFAVAVIAGLAGGNPASSVILRAIVAMVVCYPIGLVAGMICERVVDNHIREHQLRNPAPPPPSSEGFVPSPAQTAGSPGKDAR